MEVWRRIRKASWLGAVLALAPASACADDGSFWSRFEDPEDGRFDMSAWLLDHKGALPVPVIITEPAIGYGGGVALLYFRRPEGKAMSRTRGDGEARPIMPDLYAGFAAGTQNGTRGYGGAAYLHFREDLWRYKGGVGDTRINLDYYRDLPGGGTRRIAYTIEGILSLQQVQRRIGDGDAYIGLRWLFVDFDSRLDVQSDAAFFEPREFAQRSSGVGLVFEVDKRDNAFTPSKGWLAVFESTAFAPGFGSDNTYELYRGKAYGYWPFSDGRFVLGARADARAANGDVPFYMQPFLELRGVPAARYQDERTALLETELRWNLDGRWALLAFAGVGKAWGRQQDFGDARSVTTRGAGFRYLIARRLGVYSGLDVAWGPEDRAAYVQVGSAWR
jgi:hypothetical protein